MSTRLYRPGEDLLTREIPDYTEFGFHRELGSVRSRGRRKEGGREVADLWGPAVGEPRGRRGACLPGPIGPCEWAGEREKTGGETELGRVHAGGRRWAGLQPVPREEVFFLFFSGFFSKTFSKSNFESTNYF